MLEQKGFTLLELVMVLLVIGFAVTLSYPSLSRGSASLQLRASSRDVLNTMRYARETAITRQVGMRVTIDKELSRLTLTDELGSGAREFKLPWEVSVDRILVAGNEVLEGPAVVRFRPNGSSDPTEIRLRSTTGGVVSVVTDPITGGARISKHEDANR